MNKMSERQDRELQMRKIMKSVGVCLNLVIIPVFLKQKHANLISTI